MSRMGGGGGEVEEKCGGGDALKSRPGTTICFACFNTHNDGYLRKEEQDELSNILFISSLRNMKVVGMGRASCTLQLEKGL